MTYLKASIGVVVIGRNEGERLKRCLRTLLCHIDGRRIVYVDSGSEDESVAYARSLGIHLVQLDKRIPFSAGRARNEGFKLLESKIYSLEYIQFIDGDCQLCQGWLSSAAKFLDENEQYAVVAGRRKEEYPNDSVFNLLCDIEWNIPAGETETCGGDFMIRKSAFQQIKGFNPSVIAGEEPEMCYRLRQFNWKIFRLDKLMAKHDANICCFSQWWRRTVRTGHAYAQGGSLHFLEKESFCLKQSLSCWIWAFFVPTFTLIVSIVFNVYFLCLALLYFFLFMKIYIKTYNRTNNYRSTMVYSFFTVIAKWPQLFGQMLFIKRKMYGSRYAIIEYS